MSAPRLLPMLLMLIAVEGKDTHSVTRALSRQVRQLPEQLRASLIEAARQYLTKRQHVTNTGKRAGDEDISDTPARSRK